MVKKTSSKYYEAIGRRKSSVARVRLYIVGSHKEVSVSELKIKQGEMYVNKKPIAAHFPGEIARLRYQLPFELTDSRDRFAVSVLITGGGIKGQLDAMVHGSSRALEKVEPSFRPILKKQGLLTRDARVKERRKVGTGGKARRQKQSPKR